jgi:hypothetical protein
MNRKALLVPLLGLAMAGCAGSVEGDEPEGTDVFHDRDFYAGKTQGSSNLVFHGESVLATNKTQAIFWGSEWSSASFAGDKITGIDSFFQGFGSSNLEAIANQYNAMNSSTYLGHVMDSSAAPTRALTAATAVAEACKMTNNNPDPAGIYFIYTSTTAGHVSYCAWHASGTCSNGTTAYVAYMPNVDGQAGCDPQDTYGTGHSQGLGAVVNVTSHELMEAITDPDTVGTGSWYDSAGAEIGDKCAWQFTGPVTLTNGSTWKLQMEWSNAITGCAQGN